MSKEPATLEKDRDLRWWRMVLLAVGVAALALCGVGWFFAPVEFFRAYLLSFVFWTGLAVGCMGVLMMWYVTGGRWGKILKRPLESAILTLPLLAVMLVPVLLGLRQLYIWTDPQVMAADAVLQKKHLYLNTPFFVGRQIAYFAIWIVMAFLLAKWAKDWRRTEDSRFQWRLEHLSAAGMFIVAITISLAVIDWVMTLEPHWYSTIYAAVYIAGEMLAAFAFGIAVVLLLSPKVASGLDPKRFRELGNLLLTFVMLWAYCSFSQYLLIWSGNLRDEITWYLPRTVGLWGTVALLLIVFHFFVPFFLLLFRDLKQNRKALLALVMSLLLMRFIDICWLVKPAFGTAINWMDIAATIGVGGIWLAVFLWIYQSEPDFDAGSLEEGAIKTASQRA